MNNDFLLKLALVFSVAATISTAAEIDVCVRVSKDKSPTAYLIDGNNNIYEKTVIFEKIKDDGVSDFFVAKSDLKLITKKGLELANVNCTQSGCIMIKKARSPCHNVLAYTFGVNEVFKRKVKLEKATTTISEFIQPSAIDPLTDDEVPLEIHFSSKYQISIVPN